MGPGRHWERGRAGGQARLPQTLQTPRQCGLQKGRRAEGQKGMPALCCAERSADDWVPAQSAVLGSASSGSQGPDPSQRWPALTSDKPEPRDLNKTGEKGGRRGKNRARGRRVRERVTKRNTQRAGPREKETHREKECISKFRPDFIPELPLSLDLLSPWQKVT